MQQLADALVCISLCFTVRAIFREIFVTTDERLERGTRLRANNFHRVTVNATKFSSFTTYENNEEMMLKKKQNKLSDISGWKWTKMKTRNNQFSLRNLMIISIHEIAAKQGERVG